MKRIRIFLMLLAGILFIGNLDAQPVKIYVSTDRGHFDDYDKEIRKGIKKGLLTPREVARLQHELEDLDRLKHRAWRNGRLTKREHERIDHASWDFERLLNKYLHNRHKSHRKYYKSKEYRDHKCYGNRDKDYYYRR